MILRVILPLEDLAPVVLVTHVIINRSYMKWHSINTPASRIKSYTFLDAIEKDRECDEDTKEGQRDYIFWEIIEILIYDGFSNGIINLIGIILSINQLKCLAKLHTVLNISSGIWELRQHLYSLILELLTVVLKQE